MFTTRLAPSPTGALHLGNARTFLVNWLVARQGGWKIILRIEDLDGPRVKKEADRQAIADLRWLGIDWDEATIYQSARMDRYAAAVRELIEKNMAYPCVCSRKEIELAASAPHAEDGTAVYPGTCRGKFASVEDARQQSGRMPAIRFAVDSRSWRPGGGSGWRRAGSTKFETRNPKGCPPLPSPGVPGEGVIEFVDRFCGHQRFEMGRLGDFIIAKADGTPAYQLAVVVDDAEMEITQVLRGDDLLDSTPRQIMLYQALGWEKRIPEYWHLPLVLGEDGRRLAKRHGDTRLSSYREMGVSATRMLQLLARWCGVENFAGKMAGDLLPHFDLAKLPRQPIIFTASDDAWLKNDGP